MLNQPDIAKMADAYKASALCAADMEGCSGLDQFARARERLLELWRQVKIASRSAEYGPQTMAYQVRLKALRKAMAMLDCQEWVYIGQRLEVMKRAPTWDPHKGAG